MDAGKLVFGKVEKNKWHENWLQIDVRTYMKDLYMGYRIEQKGI